MIFFLLIMAFVEYLQKFLCVCVLWVVKNLARLRAPHGTGWRKALLTKDRSVLEATQGIHCWWSADAFGLSSSVCASQKSVIFCSDAECRACLVGEATEKRVCWETEWLADLVCQGRSWVWHWESPPGKIPSPGQTGMIGFPVWELRVE